MTIKADDAPWRKLIKRLEDVDKLRVRVGVLGDKAGQTEDDGISMVELYVIHEFGSPAAHIPERSSLRRTFADRKNAELKELCAKLLKMITDGKLDARKALSILGQWGASEVKNTITQTDIPPPLQLETIARKGSSKPLIDTGRMMNSISYEVVEK